MSDFSDIDRPMFEDLLKQLKIERNKLTDEQKAECDEMLRGDRSKDYYEGLLAGCMFAGGHKKIPADLVKELAQIGYAAVKYLTDNEEFKL